mmetsp:Transcript_25875/g.79569  ORF Transcript_25875/g.79569 Transcript_25875/m.79569 type:complete len:390 (-) Transcript_25875:27-1196(-)
MLSTLALALCASRASSFSLDNAYAKNEVLVDRDAKFALVASAKGGATVASQLMFRRWGLLEAARSFDPTAAIPEHVFRHRRLPKLGPRYQLQGFDLCADCRRGGGWKCAVVVRSPLDRAVSSYVHVLRYNVVPQLEPSRADASFREFHALLRNFTVPGYPYRTMMYLHEPSANVLHERATWAHAGPQTRACLADSPADYADVFLLPTETIDRGGLDQLFRRLGVRLAPVADVPTRHYVAKAPPTNAADLADLPFSEVRRRRYPAYDGFFRDEALAADVFAAYRADVAVYARACRSPALRDGCAACADACDRELARLADAGADVSGAPPPYSYPRRTGCVYNLGRGRYERTAAACAEREFARFGGHEGRARRRNGTLAAHRPTGRVLGQR